ncbi:hypothetical protein F862_gp014 [Vibrio phage vB_VpaS_MAR10]|uniref:Lipoprotein n=1 Tax=Vibrio phage vB_VpaS_MAR10 TaxID=1229755 RepID=K7R6A1_9CAUD|nr:hypothetical protein F862_gp014 [Vibrio phage vB_VpaS_MAR10]AFV81246.1 hypothetical protein MAR10_014 [Vibrio phage vB_VpaS_MAR10]AXH68456.1 hypothetical protein [Vibrio phage R01]
MRILLILALALLSGCASPERLHNMHCDQWVRDQVINHGRDMMEAVKECGYKKTPRVKPGDLYPRVRVY